MLKEKTHGWTVTSIFFKSPLTFCYVESYLCRFDHSLEREKDINTIHGHDFLTLSKMSAA